MGEEKEVVPESQTDEDARERESGAKDAPVRFSKPFLDDENAVPVPAGPIL